MALPLHQGRGNVGQGQLLDGHENLLAGGLDGLEQQGFQVVTLAPLAADRAAVAVFSPMVEGKANTGRQRQFRLRWPQPQGRAVAATNQQQSGGQAGEQAGQSPGMGGSARRQERRHG